MMIFLYSQTFSKDIAAIFQLYISLQHYMCAYMCDMESACFLLTLYQMPNAGLDSYLILMTNVFRFSGLCVS